MTVPDSAVEAAVRKLAAAPEPPASVSESPDNLNSQGSLDGSEPMMTDAEFDQLVEDVGQPEDTFPYLRVPLTPAADPVKAQLVEALKALMLHTGIVDVDDRDKDPDDIIAERKARAALAAAEAEENGNKG